MLRDPATAISIGRERTSNDVGGKHGISQAHRMAHVVRVRGGSVQRDHVCDEDDDSPASCEYDMQRTFHCLWIFFWNLSNTYIEPYSSPPEYRTAAANEKVDSGCRGCGVIWRNVDRLAEAVYVSQQLPQGRYCIP